ncbi:MAG: hypothetical protein ACRDZX_09825 [Acidimicrobiales bacterium]
MARTLGVSGTRFSGLLGAAAEWLRLGHVDRLLAYTVHGQEEAAAFYSRAGFCELTRTVRGYDRPGPAAS